jgi:hypothetical protein
VTSLQGAGYVAQALAALSAYMLARRRPGHIPAAVALALLATVNLLDAPIAAALTPARGEPWQGSGRVLVYLDGAINLANDAIVAGLPVAIAVAPERRRRAAAMVAGAWLLASVVLAALYPSPLVRGAGLQRIYIAAELIGLFVATVALITWARAGIAAKRSPEGVHAVALGMTLLDAAILLAPFSPWRAALFEAPYGGVQLIITAFFAVVTAAQVIAWWTISSG